MNRMYYIWGFIVLALVSCREEAPEVAGGSGWLSVECLTDNSLQTRSGEASYKLEIQKPDGSVVASYDDVSSITDRILLASGKYKLVATNGENVVAGFEKPYYRSEVDVKIEPAVTKEVAMVCTQANVKVSVAYSEKIKKNFVDYSLEVTNGEGEVLFGKDETRAGYLRVNGDGSLVWNLTLNNGQESFELTKTITGVEPRQYYRFTFDVKESGDENEGAFVPGITVDTTADVFDWVCDVVLKETIAKPEIKGEGFGLNETVLVLDEARGVEAKVGVIALAQIQELTLRHNSAVVKALGVPEAVVLTNIQPAVKEAVNAAGITWGNESVLDAQSARIDFTGLLEKLPLGDYKFAISVYDARKRLVRDTLRVSVIPDMEHVADEVGAGEVWAKFATIRGRWYTTERPEGMGLEISEDQATWTDADVAFQDGSKLFSAYLTNLKPNTTYYFRTKSASWVSDVVRQFHTESADQIPYLSFDNWFMDGKSPMLGVSGQTQYWDSGNPGGASYGFIPTTEEKSNVVKGSAAKLASLGVTVVVKIKFAAGNLYTGKFVGLDGTNALLDFGIPYACRPTTLNGWYKYRPGTVNWGNQANMSGKTDSCHIYVVLTDWKEPFRVDTKNNKFVDLSKNNTSIIALGELKTDQATPGEGYANFSIPLEYRDKVRKPTYALIVASASKYGDYFTGSDNSVLWIDEFELGFDAPSR